jgi:hypothetical protein
VLRVKQHFKISGIPKSSSLVSTVELSGTPIRVFWNSWNVTQNTKLMQNPNKVCELCSEEFTPKRTDARFCGRKCQYTSNNRSKAEDENYLKLILPIIRKNRNVLKSIYESQSMVNNVVSRDYLIENGFSFGYLTMYWSEDKTKREIHIIGDYSLEMLADGNYKVEKNDRF